MKIPKKLKIGGHVYSVELNWESSESPHPYGRSMHDAKIIKIAKSVEANRRLVRSELEETFLHEILHCVDYEYYSEKTRESIIRQLSKGLYQVLNDNNLLK